MFTCLVCQKEVYGHPDTGKYQNQMVCGNCSITKTPLKEDQEPAETKSLYQVNFDILKLDAKTNYKRLTTIAGTMSYIRVKSNFARNQVVLLDGKYPLTFDAFGETRCPTYLRQTLERLIAVRPGRFQILDVVVEPVVEVVEEEVPQEVELREEKVVVREKPPKKQVGRPKKNLNLEDI